jgi:hypothetical protein
MELTFREFDKAQKAALDLVNFGKVRIERCYRMNADGMAESGEKASIDVVYKLYMEVLWTNEDLLKILDQYSKDFEEDMADVRNMLAAKETVLNEILKVLESGGKREDEIISVVQSRLENLKVFASREAIKSLIDDLEEEGFVIKDDLGRISLSHAQGRPGDH